MVSQTPTWPAMLQFAHAAELSYLADEQAWQQLIGQTHHWHTEDRLIDRYGHVFGITLNGRLPTLSPQGFALSLDQTVELLGLHLADAGQCCVSKAGADSVLDVLHQLASMAD